MDWALQVVLIVVSILLLLLSSFFSAAEMAYSSLSKFTISKNLKQKKRSAQLIKKHYKSFGWTLTTILIGNNAVNVAISSIVTFLFARTFSDSALVMVASILVITPIVVIFGEVVPKLLAKKYSYGYLTKIVFIMEFFRIILFPLTFPFAKIVLSSKTNITENEVKDIARIAAHQKEIKEYEAVIVSKALELDSLELQDIMILRQKFVAIKAEDSISKALGVFKKSGHSRLPVLKNNRFIGVLLLKDIFFNPQGIAESFTLKIPSLPKTMSVTKALEFLRANKSHIAFVHTPRNKAKTVIGLVTFEDIFEEIFGEIYDEHDEEQLINQIAPNKWIVDGSVLMKDLQKEIKGLHFQGLLSISVRQWVQKRINKTIKIGHKYTYKNALIFKVISNQRNQNTKFEVKQKLK